MHSTFGILLLNFSWYAAAVRRSMSVTVVCSVSSPIQNNYCPLWKTELGDENRARPEVAEPTVFKDMQFAHLRRLLQYLRRMKEPIGSGSCAISSLQDTSLTRVVKTYRQVASKFQYGYSWIRLGFSRTCTSSVSRVWSVLVPSASFQIPFDRLTTLQWS